MIPPLKERIKQWFCKLFGHKKEFSHIYAGKKHYHCKRCRRIFSVPLGGVAGNDDFRKDGGGEKVKSALSLIVSIFIGLVGLVVGGVVISFGWNNFVTQATTFPSINIPVAIGIDLTMTYITGYATPRKLEQLYESLDGVAETIVVFLIGVTKSLMILVAMYLVTLFM